VTTQIHVAGSDRYAKAGYHRKGVWRSAIIAVVALLVFVAAVVAIDRLFAPQLSGFGLLIVGIVLAVVPAGLWLAFFYVQDQLEAEPVGSVGRMFVIGFALAGAIGIPLTNNIFHVQDWLYRDTTSTILGSLLIGAIETFIIYATVRYFIFDEPEFDERTDGVVYCTAAALGYATAINLQFILSSGGNGLGGSEIYIAELALAYAAFGGVIGYFLGHAKLERDPVWWMPLGFLITVLLSSLFFVVRGQLETGSINVGALTALPSIKGLVLAGVLAAAVTAIVSLLVHRDVSREVAGLDNNNVDPTLGDRQANWVVVAVFAVLLVVGIIGWITIVNGVSAFDKGAVRGSYPANYGSVPNAAEVLHVADRVGSGAEFIIVSKDLKAGQDVRAVSSLLAAERGSNFVSYKLVDTRPTTVNGKQAQLQQFAYVDPAGLTGSIPRVIQGTDYIFMMDNRAVIVTLLSTPESIGDVDPAFTGFVNSLSFK
jgi:RsiW-degrading membrane proteinase PrsW (M82 family)